MAALVGTSNEAPSSLLVLLLTRYYPLHRIGVLQYVLYYWYGEIDANKLTFYQGNFQKLPINPGNVRKAWWSTTTASGQ